ncbi:MAG: rRNA adenine dimethyltransferase family protein [Candidatus Liptonbacteria bacterium]|nr:rRNA adenine dimethyltransferase family protein [Candidatus Liptonbacteria bacterium]
MLDSALAQNLESRIENLELQKYISVIRGDVLKILDSKFQILNSYKLVGNIPYYITGHLLRVVGELEKKPELCVFTIQKEVAERIVAEPPQMNRLAASVQFWAEPKIIAYISRRDFSPPPEVDSAIIKLETRDTRHEARMSVDKYYGTVRTLFAQPRKTILSNLSAENRAVRTEKEKIAGRLRGIGIDPLGRPQDLSIEDIKKISALAP